MIGTAKLVFHVPTRRYGKVMLAPPWISMFHTFVDFGNGQVEEVSDAELAVVAA